MNKKAEMCRVLDDRICLREGISTTKSSLRFLYRGDGEIGKLFGGDEQDFVDMAQSVLAEMLECGMVCLDGSRRIVSTSSTCPKCDCIQAFPLEGSPKPNNLSEWNKTVRTCSRCGHEFEPGNIKGIVRRRRNRRGCRILLARRGSKRV